MLSRGSLAFSCLAPLFLAGAFAQTTTFTSGGSIPIPTSAGNSSVYPTASPSACSNNACITVSGMTGAVQNVTLRFNNWTTPGNTDNLAILLQGPAAGSNGASALDVASNVCVTAGTFTLADTGSTNAGISSNCLGSASTMKPTTKHFTNFALDVFTPGPGTTYQRAEPDSNPSSANTSLDTSNGNGTFAYVFNGMSSANGVWRLFVSNQGGSGPTGSISSWSLTITTAGAGTSTTTTLTSHTPNPSFTSSSPVTLTAQVTSSTTVNTGNVLFHDNGVAGTGLSGAGDLGTAAVNSSGVATLSNVQFVTEGAHQIIATYQGGGSFAASTSPAVNHEVIRTSTPQASPPSGTVGFCNAGGITLPSTGASPAKGPGSPYPSSIVVSGQSGIIQNLRVYLNSYTSSQPQSTQLLLVGPNGKTLDFASNVGGVNAVSGLNLSFDDTAASQASESVSFVTNTTYKPTVIQSASFGNSYCTTASCNTIVVSEPAPATIERAGPFGSPARTFSSQFDGASPNGTWQLFAQSGTNTTTETIGNWCINFTLTNGAATTTTLASSANPSATGAAVTFTATVTSGGNPVTSGSVIFSDSVSGTNLGTIAVSNGVAVLTNITNLAEGTHIITASYTDGSSFGPSSGTFTQRVNNPTVQTGTKYCNQLSGITIPAPSALQGPSQPYPSNIAISGLPGTVNTVEVDLNTYNLVNPSIVKSLIVGPCQSASCALDFFSPSQSLNSGPFNLAFFDASPNALPNSPSAAIAAGTYKPFSLSASNSYVAPAPTLTSANYAAPAGSANFATIFGSTDPNGTWSLYEYTQTNGVGSNNGTIASWCVNLTINKPVLAISKTHIGPGTSNAFVAGQAASYTIAVTNNGPGSTAGAPLTVSDNMPTGLTISSVNGGTDWNCSASTSTAVSCTSTSAISAGSSFSNIVVTIAVAAGAPATVSNTATVSGGTFMTGGTASDNNVPVQIATTTTVGSLSNFSVSSSTQTLALSATVSAGASPAPSVGTVTFTVRNSGNVVVGSAVTSGTLSSGATGTVNFTIPANQAAGTYTVTAVYNASGSYTTSSGTGNFTISSPASLSITKSHTGTFTQGQLGSESGSGAFTFVVSNSGPGATSGTITVTDTLPSGWTAVGYGPTGPTGWACLPAGSPSGNTFNCNYTQSLAASGSAPTLTLNIAVPATSAVSVNNQAKVFGGGDPVHTNSTNAAVSNTVTATVVQVPNSLVFGGINQTVQVNTAFPLAMTAQVLDAGGVPIVGINVTFTAPASGPSGTFAGATNTKTVATNGSGVASPGTFTANAIAGPTYQISVTAGAISNSFNATNISGPATQMTANSGTTPQTAAPTAAFAVPLAVTVKDALNNPVSGLSVLFTAPPTNPTGTFSNAGTSISVLTNSSGVATAAFTASAVAGGPYNVTASAGSLSTTFSLTNGLAPAITVNPSDSTVNAGQTATFSAAASGAPTPTVQWQVSTDGVNFSNISGATSTTLSLPSVTAGQDGTKYKAVFTNATGTATSNVATLTVNSAPTVTTNPVSQSISAGSNVSFTAAATGKPAPTVQWQLSTNGGGTFADISGATSTTLLLTAVSAGSNGNQYRAVFTNSVGSATTTAATLTVTAGPVITTNPTDVTVNAGGTAVFTAAATGTPTPTVQWQFSTDNGATFSNVAGAITTTLTVPNVTAGQNGTKFRAVFTNASGTATTTAATMTVNSAPTVTTNPVSQSISAGSNVSFTAAANGNPTPTVQWQSSTDGGATFSNIVGATSTTLLLTAVPASSNGNQYRAVFTNSVGSATTTAATLTVTAGPVITTNPADVTLNAGGTAVFTAAATGTPTPTVQWQFSTDNGATFSNVAGATTTTLTVPNVTAGQNGTKFRAVFTNASGTATTTSATMTVNFAPTVTTNPVSQSISAGSNVSFTAAANGNPTPTVQWQISTNGGGTFTNIAGATSTTLLLTAVPALANGNQYRAVFTNSVGSATTTAATLTVTAGPVITTNPADVTLNAGGTAVFTAAATGTPTPTVQWQFSTDNGATFSNVAGATTTTLTVPNVTAGQNGTKFRAVFTNASGTATTTAATMTVNSAPTVTTNPVSQSISAGSNVSFTAAANGNPTPTVQWQISTNGGGTFTNIAGATSTTLLLTAVPASANGNQYRAAFTNSVGSATTTAATLTVTAGPVITTNPADVTLNAGGTAVFTAAATGTPTPTVQWQFSTDNGATFSNVAGATTTTLTVPNVTAGQNGTKFRAVFTNASGTATTTAATMTVNSAPTVTTNPVSQSISAGSNVSFTAAANGNPTPTVQWQISTNGGGTFTNIAGATSTTLLLTAVPASANGNQYRAAFTNSVGSATTTAATLTVTAGPVITTNPADVTLNAGGTAVFTAAATGSPTPTVQWQFSTDNGATFSNVAGATTTTLTVPNVTAGQNGTKFRAVFTNASGTATTTSATMTVNFAPTVTTNPLSQSISAGSNVSFTVAASGNPTPTVQWYTSTDGGATFVILAGATNPTLSFVAQTALNGVQYRATFTNSVGSATTTAATLTVTAGPVITTNPVDVTINAGGTAVFTAAATGTPTPTVQWYSSTDGINFSVISGATTTTLTLPGVTAGQNGTKYRAVFTNASGTATTTSATLTVNFAPTVTTNPVSQSITAGSNVSFTAAANGNPAPTLQWQQSTDGGASFTNIAGATSTTLSFTALVSQNGNQFRAVFTNTVGSATTTAATLTVTGSPVVTLNPVNVTVAAFQTATFTAAATGTPAPTVQWQVSVDGGVSYSNISGATSTTLSFTADGTMNGFKYRAVFTNVGGSATTTAATLTVTKLTPTITWANPADLPFGSALGATQLNATASVPGTFTYTPAAGTALPLGNGQTLSVLFTPTASANYTTATASVLINIVQPAQGPGQLLVTYLLARDPSTNEVLVTVNFANTGGTAFTNVVLNTAAIGAVVPTSPALPVTVAASIAGNSTASVVLRFPASVGTTGTRAVLTVAGAYDQGTISSGGRVVLP